MSKERIGQRLIRSGYLQPEQLEQALQMQEEKGGMLGDILIGLGALTESQFQECFAQQENLDYCTLEQILQLQVMENLFLGIPYQVALNHLILPIYRDPKQQILYLVTFAPLPHQLERQILFQTRCTHIRYRIATREAILQSIHFHYGRYMGHMRLKEQPQQPLPPLPPLLDKQETIPCPNCQRAIPSRSILCPHCDALVHDFSEDPLTDYVLDGQWKLTRRIGEGGMGAVYEGIHVQKQTKVAIKLLRAQIAMSERVVQRFYHEAQTLHRLEHPNIIELHHFGYEKDIGFFLVMELLEGCDLNAFMKQRRERISLQLLCRIFLQVCQAMSHAHRNDVVHRDLKPDNIFILAEEDVIQTVKVIDFGIAKNQNEDLSLTKTGTAMGTPRYISPEQAQGDPVDPRSDIYAFCVILFESLTGKTLFQADSPYQYAMRHVYTEAPTLQKTRPEIQFPAAFYHLTEHGLAKQPEARPPSMQAVNELLQEALQELEQNDIFIDYPEDGALLSTTLEREKRDQYHSFRELAASYPESPAIRDFELESLLSEALDIDIDTELPLSSTSSDHNPPRHHILPHFQHNLPSMGSPSLQKLEGIDSIVPTTPSIPGMFDSALHSTRSLKTPISSPPFAIQSSRPSETTSAPNVPHTQPQRPIDPSLPFFEAQSLGFSSSPEAPTDTQLPQPGFSTANVSSSQPQLPPSLQPKPTSNPTSLHFFLTVSLLLNLLLLVLMNTSLNPWASKREQFGTLSLQCRPHYAQVQIQRTTHQNDGSPTPHPPTHPAWLSNYIQIHCPVRELILPAGTYQIILRSKRHRPLLQTIQIQPNQRVALQPQLRPN